MTARCPGCHFPPYQHPFSRHWREPVKVPLKIHCNKQILCCPVLSLGRMLLNVLRSQVSMLSLLLSCWADSWPALLHPDNSSWWTNPASSLRFQMASYVSALTPYAKESVLCHPSGDSTLTCVKSAKALFFFSNLDIPGRCDRPVFGS